MVFDLQSLKLVDGFLGFRWILILASMTFKIDATSLRKKEGLYLALAPCIKYQLHNVVVIIIVDPQERRNVCADISISLSRPSCPFQLSLS